MARTIAEIQQEIIDQKEATGDLSGLTSTSKSALWRLWIYIVATAIWLHETIVERNALVSRPHTLNWYREQALNYHQGFGLIWEDGYFQIDTTDKTDAEVEAAKIIKHCAVTERFHGDLQEALDSENAEQVIAELYYNQLGIITFKIAKEESGEIKRLQPQEKLAFRAYMNEIKDAGNQIYIHSLNGDKLYIKMDVYVDPLLIYTTPLDEDGNPFENANGDSIVDDEGIEAGTLITDPSQKPIEEAITNYITTLEFNGAIVPTYLMDAVQKTRGVKLPLLRKLLMVAANDASEDGTINYPTLYTENTDGTITYVPDYTIVSDDDNKIDKPFYIPNAGYFSTTEIQLNITYLPHNLQEIQQ